MRKFAGGLWAAMGIVLLTAGCSPSLDESCQVSMDCQKGQVCQARKCIPADQADGSVPADEGVSPPEDARVDSNIPPDAEDGTLAPDEGQPNDANLPDDSAAGDVGSGGNDGDGGNDGGCTPSAEICDGIDNDCDDQIDEGVKNACGRCGPLPQESCNGLDDDCNGQIDDNADGGQECQTSEPGVCTSGIRTCVAGEFSCVKVNSPAPELCDDLDNDCDGDTDEDFGLGEACMTGEGVCAREGQITCAGCSAEPGLGVPEVCDGADNDCDGEADDGLDCDCEPGTTQACYTGSAGTENNGPCHGGTQTCGANHSWGACMNQQLPEPELCDGEDNDCDGQADDVLGAGDPCTVGLGTCRAEGTRICGDGQLICSATPAPPTTESCDDLDNDCDGNTDEDFGLGEACSVGQGACVAQGRFECGEAGNVRCAAEAGLPTTEVCNNTDDDCNGQTDDVVGVGDPCAVGIGSCRAEGTRVCGEGQLICSATPRPSSPEICDGEDNDCDGNTDEGDNTPHLQQPCYDGPAGTRDVGSCRSGTQECVQGELADCVGETTPASELCDGLDNDCDGMADQGNPEGGQPCDTGALGICARGQTVCAQAILTCEPEKGAQAEDCINGADDNCDGRVDNGPNCTCTHMTIRACYDGPEPTRGVGACHDGESRCAENGMGYGACEAQSLPILETCDGLDNNCDGQVDDSVAERACYDGPELTRGVGACHDGRQMCLGLPGWGLCEEETLPVPETCDGIDNNCDGQVDDGNLCPANQECRQGQCLVQGCEPLAETCDGVDNNCDGTIDDGARCDPGLSCLSGQCQPTVLVGNTVYLKTEVTVGQFGRCANAGACVPPGAGAGCTWEEGNPSLPINCLSWVQAVAYCTWMGGRLPSQAEFRAPWTGSYPWGDDPATCNLAVINDVASGGAGCGQNRPLPVCSRPAGNTQQGICDMAGGVSEFLSPSPGDPCQTPAYGGNWQQAAGSIVNPACPPQGGARYGFRCVFDAAALAPSPPLP